MSQPDPESAIREPRSVDPENRLLHRMPVRRLEAEAIRDAILAVSGRLDRTMHGPSVLPYLTPHMEGRGRPQLRAARRRRPALDLPQRPPQLPDAAAPGLRLSRSRSRRSAAAARPTFPPRR